jgi:hypothetical protein
VIRAEAKVDAKFCFSDMITRIDACRRDGHVFGAAGFGSHAKALAVLVPVQAASQPLAIAIHYGKDAKVNEESLLQSVREAMRHCLARPAPTELAAFPAAA